MPSPFIQDGYTLTGKVPARSGLYDDVNFCYRPALPEDYYSYLQGVSRNGTPRGELGRVTALLVKHLVSWDIQEDKEVAPGAAEISEANLARLYPPILLVMVNHVTGFDATESEKNLSQESD